MLSCSPDDEIATQRERGFGFNITVIVSDDIEIFKNEEFNLYIWSYLQVSELLGDGVGSAELVLQQGERFCTVLDLIGS